MDTYKNRCYGMKVPKKLEEKRDELAQDICVMPWTTLESDEERKEYFNQGFNACANLLLPEIEKLEEALFRLTVRLDESASIHDIKPSAEIVNEALQSLREFLGEI